MKIGRSYMVRYQILKTLKVHYMQIHRDLGGHPEVSPDVGRVEEDWLKASRFEPLSAGSIGLHSNSSSTSLLCLKKGKESKHLLHS